MASGSRAGRWARSRLLGALTVGASALAVGAEGAAQGGGSAVACYEAALEETTLNTVDAVTLCTGATSSGPLACYLDGEESTLLSQENLVVLCRCAEDTGPVRCYERAQRNATLTNQQIVTLCAPSIQGTLYPSCEPAGVPRPEPEE